MLYLSKGSKETEKLAGLLLKKISKLNHKKAIVVALEGELGAGKTVFVKGVARALKIKAKIKSPTFTLMKKYSITSSRKSKILNPKFQTNSKFKIQNSKFLYHLDCYRLKDHRDLKILGVKEILNNPQNIVLIEWSDRVREILPQKHIKIHIDHIDKNKRKIEINNMYSPPSLKLRKGTSSLNEEMLALRSSEGAKK
ncbi:MAG: tRNA (adenosine(37)-N6)-threonylcarbamoyltransferase complex ATPase subunit type 1 TsaE [Candidatus Taylorbacteria bacterium]|nr:tRNA (adenosine(37)-N6)-threonylcarbamoyltransferase complex ATPase subunit type 1 TsaE [Candidatus Taylorbacteria bacterium]